MFPLCLKTLFHFENREVFLAHSVERALFISVILAQQMERRSLSVFQYLRWVTRRSRFEPSTSRIQSGAIFLGVQYEYERVLLRAK
jgi:hypothetical protein